MSLLKEKLRSGTAVFLISGVLAAVVVAALIATLILLNLPEKAPKPEPKKEVKPSVLEENPLKPEDFVYEGDYLTCTAAPSRLGIDVSQHQGNIDWEAVKAAGVSFVIIRIGGRGYGSEGSIYYDDLAQSYYQGAKAAGLDVGAYFFSQAITPEEAREEASFVLEQTYGWEMTMPIVCDWEQLDGQTRTSNIDPRTLTDCMKAFCQTITDAGKEAMLYFNPDHAQSQFYIEEMAGYDFWLAYYTQWMDYPYKVDMWQYTNEGSVAGIEGNVDINLYFPEAK